VERQNNEEGKCKVFHLLTVYDHTTVFNRFYQFNQSIKTYVASESELKCVNGIWMAHTMWNSLSCRTAWHFKT